MPPTKETAESLRAKPGIDLCKQILGTTILVETDNGLFELQITNPQQAIVLVSGTDSRLHKPVIGRFLHSCHALDSKVVLDRWIGQGMRMVIAFRNATYTSGIVMSATVRGSGWHYDVF